MEGVEGNACDGSAIKQAITHTHTSVPCTKVWKLHQAVALAEKQPYQSKQIQALLPHPRGITGGAMTSCPNLPGSGSLSPQPDSRIHRWALGFSLPFPFFFMLLCHLPRSGLCSPIFWLPETVKALGMEVYKAGCHWESIP